MSRGRHPLVRGIPPAWAVGWGDDRYGVFASFGVGQVEQRMRWIPPGTFLMGSPEDEEGRFDREGPQHRVTLTSGYWMADTPVTQALWVEMMGENPSRFRSLDRPVEQVNWEDCVAFCKALNERVPGLEARLPSEAEWEYACRAGTNTATWQGPLEILGHNNAPGLDAIAWYGGNSGYGTEPVAQKLPNPWGLYDALGNVYEWCLDKYAPYTSSSVVDPVQLELGSNRVIRGGSWNVNARDVRCAYRLWSDSGYRFNNLGFRLARGPSPVSRDSSSDS